ncbi:MAG: YfcE family phosphodiesterase [Desulforhopalus sp.]
MSKIIGLLADVHATAGPLRKALTIFRQEGVDLILCLGDIAGYGTELERCIELLTESGCVGILGNHDSWHIDHDLQGWDTGSEDFFNNFPVTWESTIEGKRIFAVHASPPASMKRGITLLDQYEQIMVDKKEQWELELDEYGFDVLVVGHTHQVFAELLGQTLVINPGSTKFNNTCAILSLPDLKVRHVPLSNTTRKVWHWGMTK